MKTNKMLPDSSISKVWENFRKMNGIILELPVNNWVAQSNGTFTNTVFYERFTSDEILEVDLYDDGNLTETQIAEYDGYITEFNILNGMIIATATTKLTEDISILCRGEIVGEKVVVNGGGSSNDPSNITASNVSCLDKDGQISNVQKELDEQNKNLNKFPDYANRIKLKSDIAYNVTYNFVAEETGFYTFMVANDSTNVTHCTEFVLIETVEVWRGCAVNSEWNHVCSPPLYIKAGTNCSLKNASGNSSCKGAVYFTPLTE